MAYVSLVLGVIAALLAYATWRFYINVPYVEAWEAGILGLMGILFALLFGMIAVVSGAMAFRRERRKWIAAVGIILGLVPILVLASGRL